MEEEHLHHAMYIVFKHFREHNLKLKPTKCEFFRNEINYLAHHVSKEGVHPSKENLKAVTEFTLPQTYTAIRAFWAWLDITDDLLRGSHALHNHCTHICLEKVPVRSVSM